MFQSMLCTYLNLQRTAVLGSYIIPDSENCWFWFFGEKNVRIKELPALVISNPLKEPTIFMKEPAMNWHFCGQLPDFSSFFRVGSLSF
jgi:hypothetical protein